jgi:hypothetical protein
VTAKPVPPVSVTTDNGDIYMVPEETQEEAPPVSIAVFDNCVPILVFN